MKLHGIRIETVQPRTPAAKAGLQAGDRILEINGQPLEDQLDLHFYGHGEKLDLHVQREGSETRLKLKNPQGANPGWEAEPLSVRSCHCHCVFCFVQQLPPGLRSSLYIKDEDYRFSFLFGNYLTLVGFTLRDLERVLRLRLSPLYVSIHTTDPELRGKLLGLKRAPILPVLEKLIAGGIRLHGQIVIVPDLNDGSALHQTLADLMPLFPGLESLSVVPVGLTDHRLGLNQFRSVTSLEAQSLLKTIRQTQKTMLKRHHCNWVFPADELLLKAGAEIPSVSYYEDYPQLENGVGMIRKWFEDIEMVLHHLPSVLPERRHLLWITGSSAYPVVKKMALSFYREIAGLKITVLPVENRLLGKSVTVAGLLGGEDILSALREYFQSKPAPLITAIFLPPDCLNFEGQLLDDFTPDRIEKHIGVPVQAFDGDWQKMITGQSVGVPG